MLLEGLPRQRLGEDVRDVLGRGDELGHDCLARHELPHEEVSAVDVLGLGVEDRVEGQVDGGGVVHVEDRGLLRRVPRLDEEAAEVDALARGE